METKDFAAWLADKLRDGSLVAEWDESLVGKGPEYAISEEDLDSAIQFAVQLANNIS